MRRGELAKQDIDQGPNSLFLFIGTMSKRKNKDEVLYSKRLAPMKWRNAQIL